MLYRPACGATMKLPDPLLRTPPNVYASMSLPRAHNSVPRHFGLWALMLLYFLSACGGSDQGNAGWGSRTIPSVEVAETRLGSLPLEQRLNGVVHAGNQVTIYPEITGRIEEVYVENGDRVTRGQALARINPRQFEDQLRQAQANLRIQQATAEQSRARLRQLEAEFERTRRLAEREFTSDLELERQRAQLDAARAEYERSLGLVEQAEATVAEREVSMRETVVRAPVDGHVGARNVEVGMRVDGSTSMFIVGDLSNMRVRVTLTEEMLSFIEPGQTVNITSERLGGGGLTAQVSRISPFLRESSFTTEAQIDVPNTNGRLTPGMYVDVDIFYGETDEATLVPNSALIEDAGTGRVGVYLVPEFSPVQPEQGEVVLEPATEAVGPGPGISDPTPVVFRDVEVIAQGRNSTGVRGIEPGEWVVVVGHDLIDTQGDGDTLVRVRAMEWDRIVSLQGLQQEDLLRQFMDKQQRIARLGLDATANTGS